MCRVDFAVTTKMLTSLGTHCCRCRSALPLHLQHAHTNCQFAHSFCLHFNVTHYNFGQIILALKMKRRAYLIRYKFQSKPNNDNFINMNLSLKARRNNNYDEQMWIWHLTKTKTTQFDTDGSQINFFHLQIKTQLTIITSTAVHTLKFRIYCLIHLELVYFHCRLNFTFVPLQKLLRCVFCCAFFSVVVICCLTTTRIYLFILCSAFRSPPKDTKLLFCFQCDVKMSAQSDRPTDFRIIQLATSRH